MGDVGAAALAVVPDVLPQIREIDAFVIIVHEQAVGYWPNDGADIAKTMAKAKSLNTFRSPQLLTLF